MEKVYIFSKKNFKESVKAVPDGCAVVSICDPDEPDHAFPDSGSVLNLDFYDVEDYLFDGLPGMSDGQADVLYAFVKRNLGGTFLVHCVAGASRSQAVGEFLSSCFGYSVESVSGNGRFPNGHVLRLLKRRFREDTHI